MGILFLDQSHQLFFVRMVAVDNAQEDKYRRALFYTLGLLPDTRDHIEDLYDFYSHQLRLSGLRRGWQTSGSIQVTRLAFNLYNGHCCHKGPGVELFTPSELFDSSLFPYFLEALKLRFPHNLRD